jgi:hypothetical protein
MADLKEIVLATLLVAVLVAVLVLTEADAPVLRVFTASSLGWRILNAKFLAVVLLAISQVVLLPLTKCRSLRPEDVGWLLT